MVRKVFTAAFLAAITVSVSGCFSLTNWDENIRMINHYGESANEWRDLTNKYFFDYDKNNPFED